MKSARNLPCPCQSGKKFKRCCGEGVFDAAKRGAADPVLLRELLGLELMPAGPSGLDLRAASPGGAGDLRLLALLHALWEVLQDPEGDVEAAVLALAERFNPLSAPLLEGLDQALYHGHGGEVLGLLYSALPEPERDGFEPALPGHDLRELALDLILSAFAMQPEAPSIDEVVLTVRRVSLVRKRELKRRLAARRELPGEAREPLGFRFDQPGETLVPRIEALALHFALQLHQRWDWPVSRAHLAAQEIEAMLLLPLTPPSLHLDPLHACRDCALDAPACPDPGRGATVLAFDEAEVLRSIPLRLRAVGGPFRCAALLEALPLFARQLGELGLVPEERAREQQERLAVGARRHARLLAEDLDDRALLAAVKRMNGAPHYVH